MVLFAAVISFKLFVVQVLDHETYKALASGQHEIFRELFPSRGDILIHDMKDGTLVPVATVQQVAFVYADPRNIEDADMTAEKIGEIFGYDDEQTDALEERLKNKQDPYEPIERGVTEEVLETIIALELPGIHYIREEGRLYPEAGLGGHVVGFVGSSEDGTLSGKYGVEGYFNQELTGSPGFLRSERDIAGRLIAIGERSIEPAVDGADVVLTIDRTIQYFACTKLKEAVVKHSADAGSVVIIEPRTGKILAMCSAPDFEPARYSEVKSIDIFNNQAIFNAYEPGSIFKTITMAAALDTGAVTPGTTFEDTGSVLVEGWPEPLNNAENKIYGVVDMTKALEESVNTGMVFAMRQSGMEMFVEYVKNFGFGVRGGVELETEMPGNISSLEKGVEIYAATASFGQGITVTPLQMAVAYAAIANDGVLMRPYVVEDVVRPDGTHEPRVPQEVRRVIQAKTARLLGAMLVSVIENGHGKRAGVPGYYIGGKTGTAQVAEGAGYSADKTIGSFAGFGPVNAPRFAMAVRIDNPKDVKWAESTAAPLFGEIAKFLLQYFEVPPERGM
jgi:cell division protein FtsI/penicillin-binding protein 2